MSDKLIIQIEVPIKFVEPYMHRTSYIINEMEKAKRNMELESPLSPAERDFIEFDIAISKSIWAQCAAHVGMRQVQEQMIADDFIPQSVVDEVDNILKKMRE